MYIQTQVTPYRNDTIGTQPRTLEMCRKDFVSHRIEKNAHHKVEDTVFENQSHDWLGPEVPVRSA